MFFIHFFLELDDLLRVPDERFLEPDDLLRELDERFLGVTVLPRGVDVANSGADCRIPFL